MAALVNVPVEMAELRAAFDFIEVGADFEHSAHVCLNTGKVYCRSTLDEEADAELPADLDTSDRYLPLPDGNDLGLGRQLALTFTAQELAADYDTVANYFRRRGAYGRFKDLLHRRGVLQRWFEYENWAVDDALREWCKEIGLQPVSGGHALKSGQ